MKAMVLRGLGGLENLERANLPDPGMPGPGQIRVRLHANSLNFRDYAIVTTQARGRDGRIPMEDGAGIVEAVGEGVKEFAVGDHVVSCFFTDWFSGEPEHTDFSTVPGDGYDGYAREYAVVPASWFTRAPTGFSHAEASTLTTAGLTAWRALVVNGGIKAGDVVLVMGSGGVSVFALQLAKSMGASVIATSSSDAKLERMRRLGADHTINYRTHADWGKRAFKLAGGRGVDHVIEVGGGPTLAQSIAAIRVGGHISLIGILAGREGGNIPVVGLMMKQARIHGLVVGSRQHQKDMVRAIETMNMRPVIDRSFPLEEMSAAFLYQESGAHFGKICLEF